MKKRNAYILTRLYYTETSKESPFMTRFTRTIQSVVKNAKNYKGGQVIWILYDDSPESLHFNDGKDAVLSLIENSGVKRENLHHFRSEKPGNSAYATICIRKKFLDLTEKDSDAFVISLDQDDKLEPNAIKSIASRMTDNCIVLSPFTIINDGGKDITGDGGKIQKKLTKRISRSPIVNSTTPIGKPKSKNDLTEIFYASSLSWSKSYSRNAMDSYVRLLETFLSKDRSYSGMDDYNKNNPTYFFYNAHPAYEDFVDFFALLLSEITISATSKNTHIYYKNVDSITCNPQVDDFRLHRTASLLALIDLCYSNQTLLRKDFKSLLFRYVTIKVVDIERILSGYRKDFKKGDRRLFAFDEATHDNYFISKLYRLAQGENREIEQDKDLFEKASPIRTESTKANFDDLFSIATIGLIPVYKSTIVNADSRLVFESAVLSENELRPIKESKEDKKREKLERKRIERRKEPDITKRYDRKKTPNQKRKCIILSLIVVWFVLILLFMTFLLWLIGIIPLCDSLRNNLSEIPEFSSIIAALTALVAAVLTFLLNELSKVNVLAKEEAAQKKLYFSEFEDLIRHIEANLKVMIEVRKQLSEGYIPASIHFINLSWPNTSCLYSDDIAKVLDKRKVDDFARLKVNLRNIQNSSEWLAKYVQEQHTHEELCNSIDWEIARHIGYLMNFQYLKNNNFQFPSQNELDYYIKEKHLKEYLSQLFMSYSGKPEDTSKEDNYSRRMEMVDKYLGMYYDDRRMQRSVLIYKNSGSSAS